ncbi:lipoyl synthase [Halosquirtibacter xylanolyticus]|uniref:lipoyl synthase n=1 Tax=Halosquirtibacter xylanolyticus TaxID=3374599 RepID=UPI003748E36E|nr:lipoyl synthase [Prolixibacteraceae bacterium]
MENRRRKPDWLKIRLPEGKTYQNLRGIVKEHKLHTICSSGRCPNMAECWGNGTATFMILGEICTRSCKFCATKSGRPLPLDLKEPKRVANSVKLMKLKHCVVTSVDRDDLDDGGAQVWAETIREVKAENPTTTMEVLIPDFNGDTACIDKVIDAQPEIISHNLETVRRITPSVRSRAKYDLSLSVLKYISDAGVVTKTALMLGLGETKEEIMEAMDDLRANGVEILTMGQYLQPTKKHLEVQEYFHPDYFAELKEIGLQKGFRVVESGPMVRSSYHAENHIRKIQ